MGSVEWMVSFADDALRTAAESTYGALVGDIGNLIAVGGLLAVILLCVNMVLQMRPMELNTAVMLVVRVLLISIFATQWGQFHQVANAIVDTLSGLAGAMIAGLGGEPPEEIIGFARAFDQLLEEFSGYMNASQEEMNWMRGAILSGIGAISVGIVGALAAGILIYAKIMIALMLGLAPIMVACSLFEVTKDYFHRWLSGVVSYAMYPLVIAGVMATVISMTRSMIEQMGPPEDMESLGQMLPMFIMLFMAAGMIAAIPLIIRSLSGNIMMVAAPSMINPALSVAGGAVGAAKGFGAGVLGTQGSTARAAIGRRGVSETIGAGINAGVKANAASGSRLSERMERARRLTRPQTPPPSNKPGPT